MTRTVRKHMSKQEKADWDELYEYVRTEVMGYDQNQSLSSEMVLRLKGLLSNKFMENNHIQSTASYSYKTVLNTFKFCSLDIQKGLNSHSFKDERHRFNYVLKVIESNINTVYMRMKNSVKAEKKTQTMDVKTIMHTGASYQRKTKKTVSNLEELW